MITEGMMVKLADGAFGEVMKVNAVNGVLFYTIREYVVLPWGECPTFQRTFRSDSEIIAIRKTANTEVIAA